MKSIPLSILVIVAGGLPGFSQSAEPASSREFPTPAARTFIQHTLEVPAFVPPEPPVEKPIPAMRVDAAVTVPTKSGRTLTILRGEASDLPDIPEPVIVPQRPPRQFTPEDLARHADQRRLLINFSAEVYENGVSILRWTHPDTAEPYQAICGFDVNLLSGIGRFVSDGRTYQLSFTPPGVRPITRHRLSKLPVLAPPQAAPCTIAFTQGNPHDPVGTATAILLRELIASEKFRLTVYQEKRAIYRQAADAWEIANVAPLRDETIWFRPHRGSRYLATPIPEKETAR